MSEFLNLIFDVFGRFFTFLDNFEILPHLSILRIAIILFLVNFAFKFLFPKKGGE